MFSDRLERLLPELRAYARMLCRGDAQSDDIVQNACLRAWQNRAGFDASKGSMRGWLFRIVRNEYYQQKRAEQVRKVDDESDLEQELVADCDLQPKSDLNRMLQAIDSLKNAQREAFLLVVAAGFTYEEAGHVLGCSAGTVKSRVSRARELALGRFHSDQWVGEKGDAPGSPIDQLHDALNRIQPVSSAA
ncbi:MAG: RNA polymerase sigma factor [Pseudomonadota bacterium]